MSGGKLMQLNKLNTYNIILLVLAILYFIIITILIIDKNESFYINVLFTVVAFIIQVILINYMNSLIKSKQPSNFIEGWCALDKWSLFITANTYLILQVVINIILLILKVDLGIAIIIQTVLLGIFVIIELLLIQSIEYIEKVEEKTIKSTEFLKNLKKEVEILTKNSNFYNEELEELYEVVRYSIPMSTDEVKSLEEDINQKMSYLISNLTESQETLNIIQEIKNDLNKRNIILKK